MAKGGLIGKLRVWIGMDNSDYKKGLDQSKTKTDSAMGSMGGAMKKFAGVAIAAFSTRAIIKFVGSALSAYRTQIDAEKKLESVIRSTGGAIGLSADELKRYAAELQKTTTFGDEATLNAMALGATFKSVKGDNFKAMIRSAQDLSVILGTDLNGSVMQLGKALENPTQGLVALRRSGISFTQKQIDEIKKLVEAGAKEEAQMRILAEIQSQVGGAAQNAMSDLTKAAKQSENAWGDAMEAIGGSRELEGAARAWYGLKKAVAETVIEMFSTTGKATIDDWVSTNIRNVDTLEEAYANLQAQIKASDEALNKWGVNSDGLSWWQKKLNGLGRTFTKVVTLGFVDNKRDEEFARNASAAAQNAYNEKTLKSEAATKVKELNLNKKSYSQLLGLQSEWALKSTNISKAVQLAIQEAIGKMGERAKEGTRAYVSQALEELKTELDQTIVGSDDEKRILKKISELEKTLEIKKEIAKVDGLKDNEAANTKELAFLKSQEQAYGTTLVYQEKLLSLMRAKEGFAKSDKERITLKAQNDELERQIKLRKEGLTGIAAIESEISKIEADLKITTDPTAVKKMGGELSGKRLELKAAVIATLPEGSRERLEAELNKIEFEKSLLKQGEQAEWDKLEANAKNIRAELDKFPKEIFPEGSLGYFDAEIGKITKGLDKLTGAELAAAQAQIALLNAQKQGVEGGFSSELDQAIAMLATYEAALLAADATEKEIWSSRIARQKEVIKQMQADGQLMIDYSGILSGTINDMFAALGSSIADFINGEDMGAGLEKIILKPLADAAVAMGSTMIAMGVAALALQAIAANPIGAIVAGAALVALGTVAGAMVQASIDKKMEGGKDNTTFAGGYSYASSSTRTAQSLQLASPQPQVVVLETRLSGSDIIFTADKARMRKNL